MRKLVLFVLLLVSSASAFAFGGSFITPNSYRWRADDGNETTASWRAPENTPLSLTGGVGQNIRLRIGIGALGDASKDTLVNTSLEYRETPSGIWTTITSSNANAFILTTSPNVAGGTMTTSQLAGSAGLSNGGNFIDVNGPFLFSYHVEPAPTQKVYEHEYVIQPTANAQTATYEFRAVGERAFTLPTYATLNYTQAVTPVLLYSGSPYCDTTGTGTVANSYPVGGVYSGDAGLVINATTGDVDIAASSNGIHTATYTYAGGSATAQVAIRPQIAMPTGMNNAPNQSICAGSATNAVTFTSPIEGLTYNWTNSNPAIGLSPSGTGDLPSFTTMNGGQTTQYAQINVKPTGGTGCTFRNMAFRIAVNPIPSVTAVADQFHCRGIVAPAITFTGGTPGAYYTWSSSNPAIGLAQRKGTNTIPSFTTSNSVGATSTIMVTPIANHCVGTPMSFQIQIMNCGAATGNTGDEARITLDRSIIAGPNPTTGVVRVQYNGSSPRLTIVVRDQFGNAVIPARTSTGTVTNVDMGMLWPGTYSIQVSDATTGASVTRTIVKL